MGKVSLLPIMLAGFLDACASDEWTGFVYPNRSDLTHHREIGFFDSLQACRDAAYATMHRNNWLTSGDYECGLNCSVRAEYGGLQVCEETKR